jgi:hypothetical protein
MAGNVCKLIHGVIPTLSGRHRRVPMDRLGCSFPQFRPTLQPIDSGSHTMTDETGSINEESYGATGQ